MSLEPLASKLVHQHFNDDHLLLKRKHPFALNEGEDQISLENHTNFGKLSKRQRRDQPSRRGGEASKRTFGSQTIRLCGSDSVKYLEARDFYQHSRFIIDVLKEDFCKRRPGGWYEFNLTLDQLERLEAFEEEVEETHLVPAKKEPQEGEEAGFKEPKQRDLFLIEALDSLEKPKAVKKAGKGRWQPEEHQRFLEALKLYGKDWERIEQHIGTRDIQNIRSHAQKFLLKLVKLIEGQTPLKELTMEEAEFYYGVLNQKLHKHLKKPKPIFAATPAAIEEPSEFGKWASSSKLHMSEHSLLVASNDQKLRFKDLFALAKPALEDEDDEANSEDSTGSEYNITFDLFPTCGLSLFPEYDKAHRLRVGQIFKDAPDIDSDDEDPVVEIILEDVGLEYDQYRTITSHSLPLIFFYIHLDKTHLRQPHFHKQMMSRIADFMEKQANTKTDHECVPLGEVCFPIGSKDLRIDMSKVEAYYRLPKDEQVATMFIRYNSKKRGVVESTHHCIPYQMSQTLYENLHIAAKWAR